MGRPDKPFVITVLAGVNGAGKSSVGEAQLQQYGGGFYNPDRAARMLREASTALTQQTANSLAWQRGKELLEGAIAQRTDFNFETTLGGESITSLLVEAAKRGAVLNLWYVGLSSIELHLARVAARVRNGGHPILEADIRRRWISSRLNFIQLLPSATNVRVYDNSAEKNPDHAQAPELKLLLAITNRTLTFPGSEALQDTPEWAKPMVVAALKPLPHFWRKNFLKHAGIQSVRP